jgi:hypothetical protein
MANQAARTWRLSVAITQQGPLPGHQCGTFTLGDRSFAEIIWNATAPRAAPGSEDTAA